MAHKFYIIHITNTTAAQTTSSFHNLFVVQICYFAYLSNNLPDMLHVYFMPSGCLSTWFYTIIYKIMSTTPTTHFLLASLHSNPTPNF